jgi:hypothetical protein
MASGVVGNSKEHRFLQLQWLQQVQLLQHLQLLLHCCKGCQACRACQGSVCQHSSSFSKQ